MRASILALVATLIAACGGSSDGGLTTGPSACSVEGQKQFVLDVMRDWYLWNNLLPADVNLAAYATPDDLLAFLTTFQPLDDFSSIGSAADDAAFLGEGEFEGYGFTSRFLSEDDWRLTRVYENGPAGEADFARGQRILALNGRSIAEIQAAEGVAAVLDTSPIAFTMREIDGAEFTSSVTAGIVTIDPVPQWRVIDAGGGRMVGYLEFAQFISTADPLLATVFAEFRAAGVNDVIIDMRYNGGGLVSTANLLGDYLGGDVAENLVFSKTNFNDDRAAANNSEKFFNRLGDSLSLSRLVVIASGGTASASELVTNSMESHVDVSIVGSDTFGKPVGQVGFEFCSNIIRATAFQTVNADDFGDYFGGLPVDCAATDDLNVPVGADNDPNVVAALSYLDSGGCPVTLAPGGVSKARLPAKLRSADRSGKPQRIYSDAY